MDAIALWPRLLTKIEGGLAGALDEAKTSFDFMLNCSFLSLLTAMAVAAIGLASPTPISWSSVYPWLWRTVLFLALGEIFYEGAIGRAGAWGALVKSAFDLYRFDLLSKLGYQQRPATFEEERVLWDQISNLMLFGFILNADDRQLPYKDPPTIVQEPADVRIYCNRTIENTSGPKVNVCLYLENRDPGSGTADKVKILETVPEGLDYDLGSAAASSGQCRVLGLKPLILELGGLKPGESCSVSYTTTVQTVAK
jgi:hypothetical protein